MPIAACARHLKSPRGFRKEEGADGIAQYHQGEIRKGVQIPTIGRPEIEHIRDTVFESAENKHHYGQNHKKPAFGLLVAVDGEEHHCSARAGKKEDAKRGIV